LKGIWAGDKTKKIEIIEKRKKIGELICGKLLSPSYFHSDEADLLTGFDFVRRFISHADTAGLLPLATQVAKIIYYRRMSRLVSINCLKSLKGTSTSQKGVFVD